MNKYWITLLFLITGLHALAQKFSVETSVVKFHSSAALEDIDAVNKSATGLLNSSTNEIAFLVPVRNFKFDNSLMEEHFNEKYMETEKYPHATFKGKLEGFDFSLQSEQSVITTGILSMHGVSKQVSVPGTIIRNGDKLIAKSKFTVRLEDFKIKIPQLLWQNIAEEVEISIEFNFKPL